eukprot:TRINITY_DN24466_c0_g3_i1.p1 TRINITY_DN24466_c0_g3~~TRINITY_DN24466_c0_g3_i1.p1  ORF type:complete len:626 (+),score=142.15 TRINITY_DN24466_c0_g3_i1:95-1972(+)
MSTAGPDDACTRKVCSNVGDKLNPKQDAPDVLIEDHSLRQPLTEINGTGTPFNGCVDKACGATPGMIAKQLAVLQQHFVEAHEQQVSHLQHLLMSADVPRLPASQRRPDTLQVSETTFVVEGAPAAATTPCPATATSSATTMEHVLLTVAIEKDQTIGKAKDAAPLRCESNDSGLPEHVPKEGDVESAATKSRSSWAEQTLERGKCQKGGDKTFQDVMMRIDGPQSNGMRGRNLGCKDRLRSITESVYFGLSCDFIIVVNAIFMAYETDYALRLQPGDSLPSIIFVMDKFFTTFFCVELILRMSSGLEKFFCSDGWNYLDLIIVSFSLIDDLAGIVGSDVSNARMLRLLRLARTVKIFRMVRVARLVTALRTLVNSLLGTLKQVVWAFLLIMCLIFIFAVIFGQVISQAVEKEPGLLAEDEVLREFWGSIGRCMYTLYMSVNGGVNWIEPARPLEELGTGVFFVFIFYIALIQWVVLNVITGAFCESAAEAARKDVALAVQTHRDDRDSFLQKCSAIFSSIDRDGSGSLNVSEMNGYLDSEPARALFAALELDMGDVHELFALLDEDDTQYVDLEEFMFGCLRLRGGAKALDIAKIRYDTRQIRKSLKALASVLESATGVHVVVD